jgi:Phospholipase_D-nuclease N-terminal
MGYVVLLLAVGVTIYALVDCWRSTDDEVRGLPRPAWILIVILFPPLGAAAYLFLGRGQASVPRARVLAPDDDPEFLRQLDQQRRRRAAEERRREQQDKRDRKDRERQQRKEQRKGDTESGTETETGDPGRPTP